MPATRFATTTCVFAEPRRRFAAPVRYTTPIVSALIRADLKACYGRRSDYEARGDRIDDAARGVGGARSAGRAGNPIRLGAEPIQAAARSQLRGGRGRGVEFERPHLRLHALEQRDRIRLWRRREPA